jgi:hypothetical protein
MANASLEIGNGNWAVKPSLLLGYNVGANGYSPVEMDVVRATPGTRTNALGIVDSKNSDIARIGYSLGTGSLLLEPQRTNLVTYSEQISNAVWLTTNSATVTADVDISPNGTMDADRLTAGASLSQVQNTATVVSGSVYTVSVWIKRITGTGQVYLRSIENVNTPITITNNWVRYSLTTTATSTIGRIGVALQTLGDSVSIWGAQLELGTYPTSYIPTLGTSVTRNQDIISKTGISDLIGQTEGTLFCDLRFTNVGTEKYIMVISDPASGLNSISLRRLTGGEIRAAFSATTSSGTTNQSSVVLPNGNYKLAYTYKSGSLKLFINGVLSFTLTPTFTFGTPLSIIRLGMDTVNSLQLGDSIKSIQLYKTALTDAECIALTTL